MFSKSILISTLADHLNKIRRGFIYILLRRINVVDVTKHSKAIDLYLSFSSFSSFPRQPPAMTAAQLYLWLNRHNYYWDCDALEWIEINIDN